MQCGLGEAQGLEERRLVRDAVGGSPMWTVPSTEGRISGVRASKSSSPFCLGLAGARALRHSVPEAICEAEDDIWRDTHCPARFVSSSSAWPGASPPRHSVRVVTTALRATGSLTHTHDPASVLVFLWTVTVMFEIRSSGTPLRLVLVSALACLRVSQGVCRASGRHSAHIPASGRSRLAVELRLVRPFCWCAPSTHGPDRCFHAWRRLSATDTHTHRVGPHGRLESSSTGLPLHGAGVERCSMGGLVTESC